MAKDFKVLVTNGSFRKCVGEYKQEWRALRHASICTTNDLNTKIEVISPTKHVIVKLAPITTNT